MLQKLLLAPRFAEAFRSTLKLRTLGWKPAFPNSWDALEITGMWTVSQWYSRPIFIISWSQLISNASNWYFPSEEGTRNNYQVNISKLFFPFYPILWDHVGATSPSTQVPSRCQSCLRFLHVTRFGPGIDQSSVASGFAQQGTATWANHPGAQLLWANPHWICFPQVQRRSFHLL